MKHFQRAVELDPKSIEARRYLLAIAVPPNTAENRQYAEEAVRVYETALKQDSSQIEAVEGIGYLQFQLGNFEKARQYYEQATRLSPKDPENYYSIAVIDWRQSYQPRMQKRTELKLAPNAPLISKKTCLELRALNWDRVNDGMQMLNKALELRPDYKDAMAYKNLMYRERADIQCGNRAAYEQDLRNAEYWVGRTLAAMKAATENK